MKNKILRYVIQFILSCILLGTAFDFMKNNNINFVYKCVIFSIIFLIYNLYCFNHGMKTEREIIEDINNQLNK